MAVKKGTRGNDSLTGTSASDIIYAFLGNDRLLGLAGNDSLYAGAGNDTLDGGAGNDLLIGGIGRDILIGGAGDDSIHTGGAIRGSEEEDGAIDTVNAGAGNDMVHIGFNDIATGGDGRDTLIFTSAANGSFASAVTLNFSKVHLAAASAIGTGVFAKTKAGGFESVDIFLDDVLANSSITGSRGDDSISISSPFALVPGAGSKLSGAGGNDNLSGSSAKDTLLGGAGDDVLGGAEADDVLTGGAGADMFSYSAFSSFQLDRNGVDRITDFNVVDDEIIIHAPKSVFNFGNEANLLLKGANPTNGTTAAGTAQVLYNTTTGALSIDANGSAAGGVTQIFTLSNKPVLTAKDIWIDYSFDFAV